MLNRTSKLHQVYAELRRALGHKVPAGDLLRLASKLVDASAPQLKTESDLTVKWRPAFDQVPLDRAFADGGWRIMARERRWRTEADDDDEGRFMAANANRRRMELAA